MQSVDPRTVQAPSPWGFVLAANVVGISMSNLCVWALERLTKPPWRRCIGSPY
jgi:hypothetical protein